MRLYEIETAMPRFDALDTIEFLQYLGGASLLVIRAMLGAPHLRAIHVLNQDTSGQAPVIFPDELSSFPQMPPNIVELKWKRSQWNFCLKSHVQVEAEIISSLASRLRHSARILSLPIESFPTIELSTLMWPQLIDLSLTANWPLSILPFRLDFLAIMKNMPSLTSFSVMVPQTRSASTCNTIWPMNSVSLPHLDSLRNLTIAYPDPEDLIFDHLPSSLNHLSLTDCPRHYLSLDDLNRYGEYAYISPILTSSKLLDILRRCDVSELRSLEVVYRADTLDLDVLDFIARSFPRLHTLKIFRYPSSAEDPVDAVSIQESPLLVYPPVLTVSA